jgi:hypothetical protein
MDLKLADIQKVKMSLIKFLEFNRAIKMVLVNKLLSSMTNYTVLRLPVLVKTKLFNRQAQYYVIDGQNMISALNKASIDTVTCFVIETDDLSRIVGLMSTLNNVVARWTLADYVKAYSGLGNGNYTTLHTFKTATGFTYSVSSLILSGAHNINDIHDGTFQVKSKDADYVTKCIVDVCTLLNTKNSKFMIALTMTVRDPDKKYKHNKFMQAIAQNKDRLKIYDDITGMRKQLSGIMNKIK